MEIMESHKTGEHEECQDDQLALYSRLNNLLETNVSRQFFQDPRYFRSIHEVINAIGRPQHKQKDVLLKQQQIVMEVIEDVVKLQHSNLNRPVKVMSDVIGNYKESQALIKGLRSSLQDAKSVLSPSTQGIHMLILLVFITLLNFFHWLHLHVFIHVYVRSIKY